MAYLHEDKDEFAIAINMTSEKYGIMQNVAEKDYYVTLILRKLSEKLEYIVFKGGTSLSKCHKAITAQRIFHASACKKHSSKF